MTSGYKFFKEYSIFLIRRETFHTRKATQTVSTGKFKGNCNFAQTGSLTKCVE